MSLMAWVELAYMEIGNKSHCQSMQNKIRRRDTISELPDELLLKILSLLPSKLAIATGVLSKRWGSLWKETKSWRYDAETSLGAIRRFTIFLHTRSRIGSLHLRLNRNYLKPDVKAVVDIAVKLSLRELRIEMVYNTFELPKSLYVSSKLETLILEKLDLMGVPLNVRLTCLKRLHLLSVDFSSDQSVKALLSICPKLEDLVVRRSSYTSI
ncbi:PREDICTED: putative FBD-associated F-box protein At1g50980 [Camelina sativa]|uniref:FBD-associated F-box protein At1g50980 n=1 Tax=Camelina sativa TaxID=90675 RepID=A0ABM0XEZ7_CAMSA|nr:PREDICTED: putative FBD-associated F-box protein At1g50980 [Camelina sativa]